MAYIAIRPSISTSSLVPVSVPIPLVINPSPSGVFQDIISPFLHFLFPISRFLVPGFSTSGAALRARAIHNKERVERRGLVFNPRRTCAARVTVVVVSVCLSVCVCVCLLSHISLLEHLFVLKTLSRTQ